MKQMKMGKNLIQVQTWYASYSLDQRVVVVYANVIIKAL